MIDDATCKQAAMARVLEAATEVASSFCEGKNRGEEEVRVPECSLDSRSELGKMAGRRRRRRRGFGWWREAGGDEG